MGLRRIVLTSTLLAVAACSEPLEFADWTVPVQEDTRVVEYRFTPAQERHVVVALTGDLLIGEQEDNPEAQLFQPSLLAADETGRIYVLDHQTRQVKVFGAEGTHLANLGRHGQGPGEFDFPLSMTIAGGQVVVCAQTRARLVKWSPSLEFLGEVPVKSPGGFRTLAGQNDGSFVVHFDVHREDWPQVSGFGLASSDGELVAEYFELRAQVPMYRWERGWFWLRLPTTRPKVVATTSGDVYVTRGDEYQLLSLAADGTHRWAMRVAAPREPYREEAIREAIARRKEEYPGVRRSNIDLPRALPALADIAVDGHGHLYVFPYVSEAGPGGRKPVDVYSSEGEQLFSGLIRYDLSEFPSVVADDVWITAVGNSVYSLATNSETGERVVVRYRLVEPFD